MTWVAPAAPEGWPKVAARVLFLLLALLLVSTTAGFEMPGGQLKRLKPCPFWIFLLLLLL